MAEELNLVVDSDRLSEMDLETFYNVDTNPKSLVEFIAHFVTEDGEFLEKEKAIQKVIKGRKIKDLEPVAEELREAMEATAVPKE